MFSLALCLAVLETDEERSEFVTFYEKYKRLVFYVARKIVGNEESAQDAAQEVFMYAAEHFDKFRSGESGKAARYLVLCARSRALNILDKEKKYSGGDEADDVDSGGDAEDAVVSADALERVIGIVKNLPERYRIPLELRANGLETSEISSMLNISEDAVRKRIQRGRAMVKERIAKADE